MYGQHEVNAVTGEDWNAYIDGQTGGTTAFTVRLVVDTWSSFQSCQCSLIVKDPLLLLNASRPPLLLPPPRRNNHAHVSPYVHILLSYSERSKLKADHISCQVR